MDAIRNKKTAWVGTILTIVIGLSAGLGILRLLNDSEGRRQGQLMLSQMEVAAARQTLETSRILARGLVSQGKNQTALNAELHRVLLEVERFAAVGNAAAARLDELGFGGTSVRETATAFARLQREIDVALALFADRNHDAAYIFGIRRIMPTFGVIDSRMKTATVFYGNKAQRAHRLANIGGGTMLLTALALLFVLRRRLDKERRRFQSRLEHEALHDPLTNLPNRRLFKDRIETACRRKRRGAGTAVMFIDLDGFKNVNDSNGHDAGDRLLKGVAQRLERCLRAGDTVARIGGDEFAIILADVTQPVEAVGLAHRILDTLNTPFDLVGVSAQIGASIGIAILNDNEAAEELCTRADTAMYAAKRAGRGAYRIAPGKSAAAWNQPAVTGSLAGVS